MAHVAAVMRTTVSLTYFRRNPQGISREPPAPATAARRLHATGNSKYSSGLRGSRETQKWHPPSPMEAPHTGNPTDNCIQSPSGVRYWSGPKSIMEIRAHDKVFDGRSFALFSFPDGRCAVARHNCWTCGNSYDGWECPVCSRKRLAEEQSRQAARQHEEQLEAMEEQREAMERAAQQQAEQAAQQEELLERQREAVEEAAERHRTTTANAWKLQAEAKSERAYSLYQSGMFEEAYRLAVQSIEQDPGNLDGFWVAASSLLSLHQADRARPYLEKLTQVLNLSEYRNSPKYFVQVLELLSAQSDLFHLGDAFSSNLRMNVGNWGRSGDSTAKARKLTGLLIELERFTDAQCVLELDLQADPRSIEALNIALALSKKLIARGDNDTANKIVDTLSTKSHSLITESYLCEMYCLLGRDGKGRIDAFVQEEKIDSQLTIEADVAQIKQISNGGQLSQETLAWVMRSVREKYGQWKSTIETQLRDTVVANAQSVGVKTGWGGAACGILSFFLLIFASAEYCLSQGFRPESTGPYFAFGALFGAILIGTLCERYIKRLRIAQEIRSRLAAAFNGENKRFAELGLPTLTTPSTASGAHAIVFLIYVGIIIAYIAGWFSLMTSQGKPLTPSQLPTARPQVTVQAPRDFTLEPPPDYPICTDEDGHTPTPDETIDVASLNIRRMVVPMRSDCWTKRFIVPANWPAYFLQNTSPTAEYEVLYMDGFRQKIRPDEHLSHNCRGIFRVRGEGNIIVVKGKFVARDGLTVVVPEDPQEIQTLSQ